MIEKSISGRPISAEKAQLRRRNLYNLLKFAFRLITKTKYEGVENIPSQGPFIMATNHISRLDTPVLFLNPVRPDITALVTTKYMDYPFMRWFVETGGGIWLDRTKADFSAFGQAAEILAQGRPLGIAPEGTRSTNSQLLEAKPGAVLLGAPHALTDCAGGHCGHRYRPAQPETPAPGAYYRPFRQTLHPAAFLARRPRGQPQTADR